MFVGMFLFLLPCWNLEISSLQLIFRNCWRLDMVEGKRQSWRRLDMVERKGEILEMIHFSDGKAGWETFILSFH